MTKRYALISVTDKDGVVEFAKGLLELSFSILSTGGTAKLLKENKVPVTEVSEVTKSPEVLGGRVKTLHPLIHGAILADKSNPSHIQDVQTLNCPNIEIVAVNLYDFLGEAKSKNLSINRAIEYIDIGGPAMLRAAAKNHEHCLPVISPTDYPEVLLQLSKGQVPLEYRQKLAAKVFKATSQYDRVISEYFDSILTKNHNQSNHDHWPQTVFQELKLVSTLRYGENSHQKAALYTSNHSTTMSLAQAKFLQGKELSYNNYIDLDSAAAIVADLWPMPAMTIIKHTNPCGTAANSAFSPRELFSAALKCDPKCAFGGIVASNIKIDGDTAKAMCELFLECVIAPAFTEEALFTFASKKNLRILESNVVNYPETSSVQNMKLRSIYGGVLAQTADAISELPESWKCVTKAKPTAEILADLKFAMSICKHVKSNAILLASNLSTIGIGAGQMSRVDSVKIAIEKARELGHIVRGSVLASDAFFPFRDAVDEAANAGVKAIIQPGGSLRDQESIDAANEHEMIMMITGIRHFKH